MLGREIKLKEMIFIAVLYVIVYAVTTFATKVPAFLSQFSLTTIIPSTFAAMLITVLFSQSSAVFFSILMALGVLFISSFQPVPCLFVLCSSIASAKIVSKTEKRIDMVFASVILAILNIIFLFALSIIADFTGYYQIDIFGNFMRLVVGLIEKPITAFWGLFF